MKRGGSFTVSFVKTPRFDAMVYPAFDRDGKKMGKFTAADVLEWRAVTTRSSRDRRLFAESEVWDRNVSYAVPEFFAHIVFPSFGGKPG